jgi:oligopeptide transport system substrate-binding protein
MKAFYIISILIVALMALAPYPLVWIAEHDEKNIDEIFDRVVIDYDDDGRPIYNNNPTIRFTSYGATISSLDPATCGDTTSAMVQGNIFEGLYGYHYLKRPVELEPLLADAMPTVSDDGLVYTIPIRRGVMFSRHPCFGEDTHGRWATREVTADDFVLAFKRTADPMIDEGLVRTFLIKRIIGFEDFYNSLEDNHTPDPSRYEGAIAGVTAVDRYTLRIELVEPFPQLPYVLALTNVAPIPHEILPFLSETEMTFRDADQLVGTGPYMMRYYEERRPIVLVRNPDYRYREYPNEGAPGDAEAGLLADAGTQLPIIDIIHMDCIEEPFTAWLHFMAGDIDSSGISEKLFDFVVSPDQELMEDYAENGIEMNIYEDPTMYWMVFQMDNKLFAASPSLRRGICLGFDVESYIDVLFNGRGRPAVNCIPASMEVFSPSGYEAHVAAGPGEFFHYDPEESQRYLALAREELAQAGLLDDNREIPTLELYIPAESARARAMADFAHQQFSRMGLRLRTQSNDWAQHQQLVGRGQAQMYFMGWHADYPDAENFLQLFYSGNYSGYDSPPYENAEYDALYEQARIMPDTPERTELYAQMARIINEDCPMRLLSEPLTYVLVYDWVENYKHHPIGYGYTQYQRINTERRRELGGRER